MSIIERKKWDEDSKQEKLLTANLMTAKKMSDQNQPERWFCIKNKPERGFSQKTTQTNTSF